MKKQDEETIEIFQKNAKYFGQIYRTYSDKSAAPKLHLLEVHAPKELRLHKTFGLFAEDPIERERQDNKVYHIKSDQKRKSRREKAEASRDISLQSLPAAVIFPG